MFIEKFTNPHHICMTNAYGMANAAKNRSLCTLSNGFVDCVDCHLSSLARCKYARITHD